MNWYIATIVYEIICGDGDHTPQFDEQLRLISAPDKKSAYHKAVQFAIDESTTFFNDNKQLVQWKFLAVPEIMKLEESNEGAELFSRIREIYHAENYRDELFMKADKLLSDAKYTIFATNA